MTSRELRIADLRPGNAQPPATRRYADRNHASARSSANRSTAPGLNTIQRAHAVRRRRPDVLSAALATAASSATSRASAASTANAFPSNRYVTAVALAPAHDAVKHLDHALDPFVEALVRRRQRLGGRRRLLGRIERGVVVEAVVVGGIEVPVARLFGHEPSRS